MLKPQHDNVLIVPRAPQEVTKNGIIIATGQEKEVPDRGRILAVGPDAGNELQVGDEVIFRKYGGDELEEAGRKILCVRATEILCVVEPDQESAEV